MAVQFNFSPAITLSAVAFSPLIGYHYFTGLDSYAIFVIRSYEGNSAFTVDYLSTSTVDAIT